VFAVPQPKDADKFFRPEIITSFFQVDETSLSDRNVCSSLLKATDPDSRNVLTNIALMITVSLHERPTSRLKWTYSCIISQHPLSGNSDIEEDIEEAWRNLIVLKVRQNITYLLFSMCYAVSLIARKG
jgi:hypothetical protein